MILFLMILFLSISPFKVYCEGLPILMSNNPSALPVQTFDFIYIPKHVVISHLPAFEGKRLKEKAKNIAKTMQINVNKFPLNCTRNQVQLVNWDQLRKISQKDPTGSLRKGMKLELKKLAGELEELIFKRRNLIEDIKIIQKTVQNRCSNNVRLPDFQFNECRAMKGQLMKLSRKLMDYNENERIILQREKDLRKQFKLF